MTTIAARQVIRHPDRFFIGGEWTKPSSDTMFDVITPSTEDLYIRVAEANSADMDQAVAAARRAFDHGPWRKMSPQDRAQYVRALGEAIEANRETIAHIWTSEMGVVQTGAQGAIGMAIYAYKQYADMADTFEFEERHTPMWGGSVGLLVREPVGVVGAIIPWNAPPVLIAYKLAPALLAGCTVVLKASPETPASALIVAQLAEQIGLPPGVLNVVTADRAVSEHLVLHPEIDKITFTGSSEAGRKIAAICGERIARCTLELGGKSAALVLDDYDIDRFADSLAEAAPFNTGQVCCSITRVVVSRSRHDLLVDALADRFRKVKVGDPFAADTMMGPLAMKRQRERVESYIEIGKQEATLATGGGRPQGFNRGFYVEPTVFGNVDNSCRIAREEIFGPVISVIPADSEDQALAIANDSVFGLNASVYTDDVDRAYALGRELRSGTVGQNGVRGDATISFGGFKQSGIGREGGVDGLMPFLESKTIILDAEPAHLRK